MAAGHIKAFISYIDDGDGSKEPALCITTKHHSHEPRLVQIGLSKAWAYTSDTYLIKKAKEFAVHIGLGDSWMETRNMADVIIHGLDSLVSAAEYEMVKESRIEDSTRKSLGSIEVMSDGKKIHEEEIFS